ncbi:unnamed protein product [Absidia cylindrospora]
MIPFAVWSIVYHAFVLMQTVDANQVNGYIKSSGGRYLSTSCQKPVIDQQNHLMHADPNPTSCGSPFSMDFKPNGKVTFKMTTPPSLGGQYLCPSGNYVTYCPTPYDFDYIQVGGTSYGGTFKFGYEGKYALDWSNENAGNDCKTNKLIKLASLSMQYGEPFHVFDSSKVGDICSFSIDYKHYKPGKLPTTNNRNYNVRLQLNMHGQPSGKSGPYH